MRPANLFLVAYVALIAVLLFAAPAHASTDPVKDTRQVLAGTVTTTKTKDAYLSGAKDGTAAFQGALSAYKAVRAAEPLLTVTCADGTVVKAPGTCPLPPPAPAPVPAPVPTATVAYDTSIGMGVDADGFAALPLRAGAHRYFVSSSTGNDANGCTAAQSPTKPMGTITAGIACITNSYEGGSFGDQVLIAEGTRYAEYLPWLAFKGGFSAAYPTVIESYDPADPLNAAKYGRGDQRGARPVLTAPTQLVTSGNGPSFLAIRGFDFNPGNVPDVGLAFVTVNNDPPGATNYVLIENNVFRYTGLSFNIGPGVLHVGQHEIVRNNSFYGMWSTGGRTGGLYMAGIDAPTVEDNVFWHDGWKIGASRDDDLTLGGATVFSHSYYLQTTTAAAIVRRNLSADGAGDCGIARGDSVMTGNLFIDCPASIGLGGGPTYNTDRPAGVSFEASFNAILGDADVNSSHTLGWAINTTNGVSGSRVHNNLILRSRNPSGPSMSGFSNNAAFPQPSYAQYDHNLMYLWVASTGQVFWPSCGPDPAYCHTSYDFNAWDGAATGTNTSSAAAIFPNPYTAAQLYAALGFADKAAFIDYVINHPEAHIQRQARALLFAGYGLTAQ